MPKPGHILVVCTGNICRSPMAEGLLKHALAAQPEPLKSLKVVSAGADPMAVSRGVKDAAENQKRIEEFQRDRSRQQQLLQQMQAEQTREEQKSQELEATFEANDADAVGGWLAGAVAVIATVADPVAPRLSVTVSRAV